MSVDFNDPRAWGYCKYCAFLVAADVDTRVLLAHERRVASWTHKRCYGSLLDPTPQPGPEAWPEEYTQELIQLLDKEPANDETPDED